MISVVFAFVMLAGILMPWLYRFDKRLAILFAGSLPSLIGIYFICLSLLSIPFSEQIGSQAPGLGISLAFGTQEIIWLLVSLFLITLHFIVYYRQFMELSLTSLVLYLFSGFAVCGILLSRDLFNLFVMIEVFSVSLIGLILARTNHTNALKAFQYLLFNSLAAAFFLLGVVLIYRQTGVLNLDLLLELSQKQGISDSAMAFILTALSLKLMLFPLSGWAKNLIGTRGGVDASFITVLMPMVFVFDLQKLSGLFKESQVLMLSILALITLLVYISQWWRERDHWRADLVFVLNALFVLLFAFHFFLDQYYLLLAFGVLSSVAKMLILSQRGDSSEEGLTAQRFELNLNNRVMAVIAVLFIFFIT